ncbi:MAG: TetR/AcrR family transcriptional regulator C-terminal domain-containing protein [Actinomycetota bacterium]|nr:TetR/AcrR family transcriptional regulator C-terminal domain-containing protein [Actinomycetota bacterium]MDQ2959313.1 TetR/AcrR family transcriptional regulator C-terminal domain-containing protein [Actinomycetota bacterium]
MSIQTSRPSPVSSAGTSLWERTLPVARDRREVLQPEQVAQSAFELAEADSLAATSVKRLANRLGVPAVRLEQYLPSREDLLDLMLDVVLGEIALPEQGITVDWRSSLRAIAIATHATASQHPWLVELIGGRPPSGPNGLRFIEAGLATFAGAGLDITEAAHCVNAVQAFVCGSVQLHAARGASAGQRDGAARNARYLTEAVAGPDYPQLAALFANAEDLTTDGSFEHGLDLLLDGIALRVEAAQFERAVVGAEA